jgi:hypothetical protein
VNCSGGVRLACATSGTGVAPPLARGKSLETRARFKYLAALNVSAPQDPAPVTLPSEDIVVKSARREAALALGMWLVAMLYTVTYCYLRGYGRGIDSLSFVLWFPDWVFWGIVVPWVICVLGSIVFAYRIMGGEPLGEEADADTALLPGEDSEVRHG